jgi:hypothetical protein
VQAIRFADGQRRPSKSREEKPGVRPAEQGDFAWKRRWAAADVSARPEPCYCDDNASMIGDFDNQADDNY